MTIESDSEGFRLQETNKRRELTRQIRTIDQEDSGRHIVRADRPISGRL